MTAVLAFGVRDRARERACVPEQEWSDERHCPQPRRLPKASGCVSECTHHPVVPSPGTGAKDIRQSRKT